MVNLEPYGGNYYLWQYIPSIPAAAIFCVLFSGMTAFHCWKAWQTRARFCIPFIIGGIFEIVGYIGRILAHDQTGQLGPYIMQSICILLAPVLFAASVYMVLGRLIRSIGADEHSIIPVRWLTRTFVSSDIICFLVQGSGSGLMAMGSSASMGKSIVLAGLAIQVLMFGLFIVVSFEFERRLNRTASVGRFDISVQWKIHLRVLNVVCALILVRSVFRVIEYALGNDGYLLSHEWSMYIFDSVPMTAVMALWAKWHPGIFRGSKSRVDHDQEWEMRSDGLESANERSVWGQTKDVKQNTGPHLNSP